jgi:hypothetical protein
MHIQLSKASVAEDRVSPRLTLPRAGTLAPGWYDSRTVLLELLYVSTAATASPAKNLNPNIGTLGAVLVDRPVVTTCEGAAAASNYGESRAS